MMEHVPYLSLNLKGQGQSMEWLVFQHGSTYVSAYLHAQKQHILAKQRQGTPYNTTFGNFFRA